MFASQALFDSVAIIGDMEFSAGPESLGGCDTSVIVIPHLHCRKVGMGSGSVPVAADWFRIQSRAYVELLAYPVE